MGSCRARRNTFGDKPNNGVLKLPVYKIVEVCRARSETASRRRASRASLWCLLSFTVALCSFTPAWAEDRLIDQEPTDRITLRGANSGQIVEVIALEPEQRRLALNLRSTDKLRVRLVDKPTLDFEIQGSSIEKIELFEQRVFTEAKLFSREGKFDQAFDNYAYLLSNYPENPGLKEAIESFLLREAAAMYGAKDYDRSLMGLLELYDRNPQYAALDTSFDRVGDRLISQYVEKEAYEQARGVLRLLIDKVPNQADRKLADWKQRLIQEAESYLARAHNHSAAGQFREANRAIGRAINIWPELPGVDKLKARIRNEYPQVVVGVTTIALEQPTNRMDDWASRRTNRLLRRTLLELVGYGPEGGIYLSPLGKLSQDASGRQITLQLNDDIEWSSGAGVLTGHDVARRLLAITDRSRLDYDPVWAEVFGGVSVHDIFQVQIDLRRAHVRPEGLLEISVDETDRFSDLSSSGPYFLSECNEKEVTYRINDHYFAATPTQLKEVVEVQFPNVELAVSALRRGEIDVLERVAFRSLPVLRADPDIIVSEYALPTVHVLISNSRSPLMKVRELRRAVAYGINRGAVLEQLILAGKPVPGFTQISGPFPVDDLIGFASDRQLSPRPYEPRLALILGNVARQIWAKTAVSQEEGENESPSRAAQPLILAYPANEIARTACETFRHQLELVEIPCQLKELHPGDLLDETLQYDLLYAELAMWEPVIQARRLLGPDGLTGGCSPYMSLALRKLDEARNWPEVRKRQPAVHRIAYDDLAVIPLWQTVNSFAYRKYLTGIGDNPVVLYQNIENWKFR